MTSCCRKICGPNREVIFATFYLICQISELVRSGAADQTQKPSISPLVEANDLNNREDFAASSSSSAEQNEMEPLTRTRRDILILQMRGGVGPGYCISPMRYCDSDCPWRLCDCVRMATGEQFCSKYDPPVY